MISQAPDSPEEPKREIKPRAKNKKLPAETPVETACAFLKKHDIPCDPSDPKLSASAVVRVNSHGVDVKPNIRTDWETRVMVQYVENADTIPREIIENPTDAACLILGRAIIERMQKAENWIKRSAEDKYDFLMRWNIGADGKVGK